MYMILAMQMILELFVCILEMSIVALPIILAVLVFRLVLRKAPKIFSYLLWIVVLVRLLCPVVFKADFGIWPDHADLVLIGSQQAEITESVNIMSAEEAHIEYTYTDYTYETDSNIREGGVPGTDSNMSRHKYGMSENTFFGWPSSIVIPWAAIRIMVVIWLVVGLGLLLYEGVSYVFFMKGVKEKGTQTPFTAGVFHPQIYLPEGLDEIQKELVTEHEKMHIKRLDYLIKPLFFLACCIHWFNPLVWLAFYLMESDMESSCDEAVLGKLGYDRKKDYAYTLLALCETNDWKLGYPIAFGERNIKNRIKDAAKAKKAPVWVIGVAAVVVVAAAVMLMVNQSEETYALPNEGITVTFNGDIVSETEHEYYVPADATASASPEAQIGEQGEALPLSEEVDHEFVTLSEGTFDTTVMNYDPERQRDMHEVLLLPNPESFEDVVIRFYSPVEVINIRDNYGTRIHPPTGETVYHSGIDFAAAEGTPVMAAAEGTVAQTGWDAGCGNYVIIAHRNGTYTYYSGCKEILAQEGAQVERGEQIATVGNTGRSTGAHLHFAVSKDGKYYEPVFEDEMVGTSAMPDSEMQESEKVDD